jgi:hypothetical protein
MSMQEVTTEAKAPPRKPAPVEYAPISVEGVRRIGESLYGSLWKDDMARTARVAKPLITCILNRTKPVPQDFAERMRKAAIERIMDIAAVLVADGMPETHSAKTAKIVRLLVRAHAYPRMPAKTEDPVPGPEVPMGAAEFKAACDVLFGERGRADAAREIGASKSMITRIHAALQPVPENATKEKLEEHAKKIRAVPEAYPVRIRACAIQRLKALTDVFIAEGMPEVNSEQTKGIRGLLIEAVNAYEAEGKKAA